ncbi:hypothetical protein Bbelb_153460 [Branchiostoma belcheri]|nr:hypothetical protein Bbelb_153460 [Branchiostoma belcheri]
MSYPGEKDNMSETRAIFRHHIAVDLTVNKTPADPDFRFYHQGARESSTGKAWHADRPHYRRSFERRFEPLPNQHLNLQMPSLVAGISKHLEKHKSSEFRPAGKCVWRTNGDSSAEKTLPAHRPIRSWTRRTRGDGRVTPATSVTRVHPPSATPGYIRAEFRTFVWETRSLPVTPWRVTGAGETLPEWPDFPAALVRVLAVGESIEEKLTVDSLKIPRHIVSQCLGVKCIPQVLPCGLVGPVPGLISIPVATDEYGLVADRTRMRGLTPQGRGKIDSVRREFDTRIRLRD